MSLAVSRGKYSEASGKGSYLTCFEPLKPVPLDEGGTWGGGESGFSTASVCLMDRTWEPSVYKYRRKPTSILEEQGRCSAGLS